MRLRRDALFLVSKAFLLLRQAQKVQNVTQVHPVRDDVPVKCFRKENTSDESFIDVEGDKTKGVGIESNDSKQGLYLLAESIASIEANKEPPRCEPKHPALGQDDSQNVPSAVQCIILDLKYQGIVFIKQQLSIKMTKVFLNKNNLSSLVPRPTQSVLLTTI